MSSRSKEKMAAAFRKLFRSSDKVVEGETGSGGQKSSGSPARRLLSRHRDIVTPSEADAPPQGASRGPVGVFKKKSVPEQPENFTQKAVRTRRLMKELKDIQRNEIKDDPVFTVSPTFYLEFIFEIDFLKKTIAPPRPVTMYVFAQSYLTVNIFFKLSTKFPFTYFDIF